MVRKSLRHTWLSQTPAPSKETKGRASSNLVPEARSDVSTRNDANGPVSQRLQPGTAGASNVLCPLSEVP